MWKMQPGAFLHADDTKYFLTLFVYVGIFSCYLVGPHQLRFYDMFFHCFFFTSRNLPVYACISGKNMPPYFTAVDCNMVVGDGEDACGIVHDTALCSIY